MEQRLGVSLESPSSEGIRAGLGKVLSSLTGKNVSNTLLASSVEFFKILSIGG